MKTVGIKELKSLVSQRLNNMQSFSGKTILLWHATYMQYGIAYRVIEHNQTNPDQPVWFSFSDFSFATDNYSKARPFCDLKEMYGYKSRGILFNTGCFLKNELKQWLKFVNSHENEAGVVSSDWVLIACVNRLEIKEEDFTDNCCIYKIQPTVDEWKQWTVSVRNKELVDIVIAYNKGKIEDYDLWERIMESIECADWEKSVKEITKSDFILTVSSSNPGLGFPAEELWDFIQEH